VIKHFSYSSGRRAAFPGLESNERARGSDPERRSPRAARRRGFFAGGRRP